MLAVVVGWGALRGCLVSLTAPHTSPLGIKRPLWSGAANRWRQRPTNIPDAIEGRHDSRERSSKTRAAWLNLSASDEQGACPRSPHAVYLTGLLAKVLQRVELSNQTALPALARASTCPRCALNTNHPCSLHDPIGRRLRASPTRLRMRSSILSIAQKRKA